MTRTLTGVTEVAPGELRLVPKLSRDQEQLAAHQLFLELSATRPPRNRVQTQALWGLSEDAHERAMNWRKLSNGAVLAGAYFRAHPLGEALSRSVTEIYGLQHAA